MYEIIDREHRRIVAEFETREEAEARLRELLTEDPAADGIFIVTSTGPEWIVAAGPVDHAEPGVDGRGWLWELRRGDEVRRVFVQVSGTAFAVTRGLARETEMAIATRGGSEVDKARWAKTPPRLINCSTLGCTVVDEDL